jgi:hypothetical protein
MTAAMMFMFMTMMMTFRPIDGFLLLSRPTYGQCIIQRLPADPIDLLSVQSFVHLDPQLLMYSLGLFLETHPSVLPRVT